MGVIIYKAVSSTLLGIFGVGVASGALKEKSLRASGIVMLIAILMGVVGIWI